MFNFGKSQHDKYLAAVRSVDNELGRLLARLETLGVSQETALIFTADHGEEFGEHGGKYHGALYTEHLHIPLLIHLPGGRRASFDTLVSLVDIPPTVLELMGLPIPDEYDGQSLVPWLESGKGPGERYVFAEASPNPVKRDRVTLIGPRWQLIVGYRSGIRRLYDLSNDPTAQNNVLLDYPQQAQQLEARLRRFMALRIGPLRITVR
jgi:arylsulfatase A-like enzyme